MFYPLLASNFDGIELMYIVPVLAVAGLIAIVSAFFRDRLFAIFFGCILLFVAGISFWLASNVSPNAVGGDITCGVIATVLSAVVFFWKN